ncbi:MAG: formyltransferase family protein, partial [Ectothiorhodospiraceae bacterium]
TGRLINVHPSLLPDYRGLHTHERVLEAGESEHGCSVHYVVPELDAGPVIAQARIAVDSGDTPETLKQRVQEQEYRIYPLAVRWIAEGRVAMRDGVVWLDGAPCATAPVVRTDDE